MRTAPINIGRCARFLYDDEEENVLTVSYTHLTLPTKRIV